MQVNLPYLDLRFISECPNEPGHYLWASPFGWHHCNKNEDKLIAAKVK